ncbi:hypothetical protein LOK46_06465 [Methylobacterium sp. NMS14P]|uniref:hypothetical protein n=1 Tax=Methylobacterium sp. NMS14P TaxID=2894310 RepID=UPI002358F093|nr:hypothetical protein [Methylobacterium sp. NMS14P]WCS26475.1 hypothetical protein LOK46_06465 [Methylobacterium sp. NMS14P]
MKPVAVGTDNGSPRRARAGLTPGKCSEVFRRVDRAEASRRTAGHGLSLLAATADISGAPVTQDFPPAGGELGRPRGAINEVSRIVDRDPGM